MAVHSLLCGVALWDLLKGGDVERRLGHLTFDIAAWFGEREAKSDDDDDELRVDDGDF